MTKRRQVLGSTAALTASAILPMLSTTTARAQNFPTRTIRYICPWTAGGTTDIVMRVLAESASKVLGQTVIVDNKPGAGGTLGAVELVNAKPDGYTLAQLPISVLRIPHMQKVQFDALKDFTWIACL
ncbi:MAG: tripartite tricarboxylate transporter substrate binding protein, partial [Actinobacteria bacterium]|nr:tripartite tricarboxylate transporter substrate binding protein [Actinomycetota bacterium]